MFLSPNIVKVIKSKILKWGGDVAKIRKRKVSFKILIGEPKGKRYIGRPRLRWEDVIRMGLKEMGEKIDYLENRDFWRFLVRNKMCK